MNTTLRTTRIATAIARYIQMLTPGLSPAKAGFPLRGRERRYAVTKIVSVRLETTPSASVASKVTR